MDYFPEESWNMRYPPVTVCFKKTLEYYNGPSCDMDLVSTL